MPKLMVDHDIICDFDIFYACLIIAGHLCSLYSKYCAKIC